MFLIVGLFVSPSLLAQTVTLQVDQASPDGPIGPCGKTKFTAQLVVTNGLITNPRFDITLPGDTIIDTNATFFTLTYPDGTTTNVAVPEAGGPVPWAVDPQASGGSGLSITELYWDPADATFCDQWVELRNNGSTPIDLCTYTYQDTAPGATDTLAGCPGLPLLAPGAVVVLYPACGTDPSGGSGIALTDNDLGSGLFILGDGYSVSDGTTSSTVTYDFGDCAAGESLQVDPITGALVCGPQNPGAFCTIAGIPSGTVIDMCFEVVGGCSPSSDDFIIELTYDEPGCDALGNEVVNIVDASVVETAFLATEQVVFDATVEFLGQCGAIGEMVTADVTVENLTGAEATCVAVEVVLGGGLQFAGGGMVMTQDLMTVAGGATVVFQVDAMVIGCGDLEISATPSYSCPGPDGCLPSVTACPAIGIVDVGFDAVPPTIEVPKLEVTHAIVSGPILACPGPAAPPVMIEICAENISTIDLPCLVPGTAYGVVLSNAFGNFSFPNLTSGNIPIGDVAPGQSVCMTYEIVFDGFDCEESDTLNACGEPFGLTVFPPGGATLFTTTTFTNQCGLEFEGPSIGTAIPIDLTSAEVSGAQPSFVAELFVGMDAWSTDSPSDVCILDRCSLDIMEFRMRITYENMCESIPVRIVEELPRIDDWSIVSLPGAADIAGFTGAGTNVVSVGSISTNDQGAFVGGSFDWSGIQVNGDGMYELTWSMVRDCDCTEPGPGNKCDGSAIDCEPCCVMYEGEIFNGRFEVIVPEGPRGFKPDCPSCNCFDCDVPGLEINATGIIVNASIENKDPECDGPDECDAACVKYLEVQQVNLGDLKPCQPICFSSEFEVMEMCGEATGFDWSNYNPCPMVENLLAGHPVPDLDLAGVTIDIDGTDYTSMLTPMMSADGGFCIDFASLDGVPALNAPMTTYTISIAWCVAGPPDSNGTHGFGALLVDTDCYALRRWYKFRALEPEVDVTLQPIGISEPCAVSVAQICIDIDEPDCVLTGATLTLDLTVGPNADQFFYYDGGAITVGGAAPAGVDVPTDGSSIAVDLGDLVVDENTGICIDIPVRGSCALSPTDYQATLMWNTACPNPKIEQSPIIAFDPLATDIFRPNMQILTDPPVEIAITTNFDYRTVIVNNGSGTGYDLQVDVCLPPSICLDVAVFNARYNPQMSAVASAAGGTITFAATAPPGGPLAPLVDQDNTGVFNDLPPGELIAFMIPVIIKDCVQDEFTTKVTLLCNGMPCTEVAEATKKFIPEPPTLTTTAEFPDGLSLCNTTKVEFVLSNPKKPSDFAVAMTMHLQNFITYEPGTITYSVDDGLPIGAPNADAFAGYGPVTAGMMEPVVTGNDVLFDTNAIPELAIVPSNGFVKICFALRTSCEAFTAYGPNALIPLAIDSTYEDFCGEPFEAQTFRSNIQLKAPVVTLNKRPDGRVVDIQTFNTYTISLDHTGDSSAGVPELYMCDQLPLKADFCATEIEGFGAIADPDAMQTVAGVGTYDGTLDPPTITWENAFLQMQHMDINGDGIWDTDDGPIQVDVTGIMKTCEDPVNCVDVYYGCDLDAGLTPGCLAQGEMCIPPLRDCGTFDTSPQPVENPGGIQINVTPCGGEKCVVWTNVGATMTNIFITEEAPAGFVFDTTATIAMFGEWVGNIPVTSVDSVGDGKMLVFDIDALCAAGVFGLPTPATDTSNDGYLTGNGTGANPTGAGPTNFKVELNYLNWISYCIPLVPDPNPDPGFMPAFDCVADPADLDFSDPIGPTLFFPDTDTEFCWKQLCDGTEICQTFSNDQPAEFPQPDVDLQPNSFIVTPGGMQTFCVTVENMAQVADTDNIVVTIRLDDGWVPVTPADIASIVQNVTFGTPGTPTVTTYPGPNGSTHLEIELVGLVLGPSDNVVICFDATSAPNPGSTLVTAEMTTSCGNPVADVLVASNPCGDYPNTEGDGPFLFDDPGLDNEGTYGTIYNIDQDRANGIGLLVDKLVKTVEEPDSSYRTNLEARVGECLDYRLTWQMWGADFNNVVLSDTMPAGWILDAGRTITVVTAEDSMGNGVAVPAVNQTGQLLEWTIGNLPVEFYTFVIDVPVKVANVAANNNCDFKYNAATLSFEVDGFDAPLPVSTNEVHVVEGFLTIMKMPDPCDVLEYGETVTYTLTVDFDGTSNTCVYDAVISDLLPSGLVMVPFASDNLDNDGDGSVDEADEAPALVGNTITVDDSNNIILAEYCPGDGPLVIQYAGELSGVVIPGVELTNTAGVTWTSLPDGYPDDSEERDGSEDVVEDDYLDETEKVITSIVEFAMSKTLVSSSEGYTPTDMFTIGERVIYSIRVDLPAAGLMPRFQIIDDLPSGMDFAGTDTDVNLTYPGFGYEIVVPPGGPTFNGANAAYPLATGPAWPGLTDLDPSPTGNTDTGGDGQDITWQFESTDAAGVGADFIENVQDDDPSNDYFEILYEVIVKDVPENIDWASQANNVTFNWGGNDGDPRDIFPDTNLTDSVMHMIVEPKLTLDKEMEIIDDFVYITLTVSNDIGGSSAFGLTIEDDLMYQCFVPSSIMPVSIPRDYSFLVTDPSPNTAAAALVTITTNISQVFPDREILPGDTIQFVFKAQITPDDQGPIMNTATITEYSTIDGVVPWERDEPPESDSETLDFGSYSVSKTVISPVLPNGAQVGVDQVVFEIAVANTSTMPTNIYVDSVLDTFDPAILAYVSDTSGVLPVMGSGTLVWSGLGTLAMPGDEVRFQVTFDTLDETNLDQLMTTNSILASASSDSGDLPEKGDAAASWTWKKGLAVYKVIADDECLCTGEEEIDAFEIIIVNTGSVALKDFTFVDANYGTCDSAWAGPLLPGETYSYTCSATLDPSVLTNEVIATGLIDWDNTLLPPEIATLSGTDVNGSSFPFEIVDYGNGLNPNYEFFGPRADGTGAGRAVRFFFDFRNPSSAWIFSGIDLTTSTINGAPFSVFNPANDRANIIGDLVVGKNVLVVDASADGSSTAADNGSQELVTICFWVSDNNGNGMVDFADNAGDGSITGDSVTILSATWEADLDLPTDCMVAATNGISFLADTNKPTFALRPEPALTYECPGDVPTATTNQVYVIDSCMKDLTVTVATTDNDGAGCMGDPLEYTNIWTAVDSCGNMCAYTQIVSVIDTTPIKIVAPAHIELGCNPVDGFGIGELPPLPTTMTEFWMQGGQIKAGCTSLFEASESMTMDDCGVVTLTREFKTSNACFSVMTATQQIQYATGVTPDQAVCPPDLDLGCLPSTNLFAGLAFATFTTSCDYAQTVVADEWFQTNCQYTVVREWTIRDRCSIGSGNLETLCTSRYVFVVDNEDPKVASINGDQTLPCYAGATDEASISNYVETIYTQASDLASIVTTDSCTTATAVFDCSHIYTNSCRILFQRRFKVTDECGNQVVEDIEYTIPVPPSVAPSLSGPNTIDLGCITDDGQIPAPSTSQFILSSTCLAEVVYLDASAVTLNADECTYQFTRTYRATNDCGQSSDLIQTITYQSNIVPVITSVLPFVNFGCSAADPRDLDTSMAGIMTDSASNPGHPYATNRVNEVRQTNGCDVTVTRYWQVDGCCSSSAIYEETYAYTIPPSEFAVAALPAIDMGCISAVGAIPPVDIVGLNANASGCGLQYTFDRTQPATFSPTSLGGNGCPAVYRINAGGGAYTDTLGNTWSADAFGTLPDTFTTTSAIANTLDDTIYQTQAFRTGCYNLPVPAGTYRVRLHFANLWTGSTTVGSRVFDVSIENNLALDDYDVIVSAGATLTAVQEEFTVTVTDGMLNICFDMEIENPIINAIEVYEACETYEMFERVFDVASTCITQEFTQTVSYVLNTQSPVITEVAPYEDLGCDGDTRTVEDSSNAVVVVDADNNYIKHVLVNELRQTNGCQVTVTRLWQAWDCCGASAAIPEVYSFTTTPSQPIISGPAQIDLGCIDDCGQIPVASVSQFQVVSGCDANVFLSNQTPNRPGVDLCTMSFERHYTAVDLCDQVSVFTQTITFALNETPEMTGLESGGYQGCLASGTTFQTNLATFGTANFFEHLCLAQGCSDGDCIATCAPEVGGLIADIWDDNAGGTSSLVSYFAGAGNTPPDLLSSTPVSGLTQGDTATFDPDGNAADYTVRWRGFIKVPTCGEYTFSTRSDDGSLIYIDGALVVNNDGIHNDATTETGTINLSRGCHEFELQYFEAGGGQSVFTQWESADAGIALQDIPDSVFFTECCPDDPKDYTPQELIDCGFLTIDDVYTTNDCEVALDRTYQLEACCGNVAEEVVTFTYTRNSQVSVPNVPKLNVGCIESLGQIPPFDITDLDIDTQCLVTSIVQDSDVPTTFTIDGCVRTYTRTYTVYTICGQDSVSQEVCYTLDTEVPTIEFTPYTDYECELMDPRPIADSTNLHMTVNDDNIVIETNLIFEAHYTNDCVVDVVRYWEVIDCCGKRGTGVESYRYTQEPAATFIPALADVDLGCIDSLGDIPQAITTLVQAQSTCSVKAIIVSAEVFGTLDACTDFFDRTYTVTNKCDETTDITQRFTYTLDNQPPTISVPPYIDYGCVSSDPRPFPDFSQVTGTDDSSIVATQLVMEVYEEQDCNITVTRTWRLVDCCNNVATKDESYAFTLTPESVSIAQLDPLDVGCIATVAQVPTASPSNLDVTSTPLVSTNCLSDVLFPAVADATINETTPTVNDGLSPTNIVDGVSKTYIQFDLSQSPFQPSDLEQVTLKLASDAGPLSPPPPFSYPPTTFAVYGLNDGDAGEGWSETGITWANAPQNAAGGALGANVTLLGSFTVLDILPASVTVSGADLVSFFGADTDDLVTFIIVYEAGGVTPGTTIGAIENADPSLRPALCVDACREITTPACPVPVMEHVSDTVVSNDTCTTYIFREYRVEDLCQNEATMTQEISYVVDALNPVFNGFPSGFDFGCYVGDPRTNDLEASFAHDWAIINANPPSDDSAVIDTNVTEVMDVFGCDVKVTRTYRIEDCCGNYIERDVIYRWTMDAGVGPVFTAGTHSTNDIGCVLDIGSVPAPDVGQYPASSICDVMTTFVEDGPVSDISNCRQMFERSYLATDTCGNTSTHTQTVIFGVDLTPPVFTSFPEDRDDFGCSTTNPAPTVAADLANITGTDDTQVTGIFLTNEVVVTVGCLRRLTRTYRIEDCCGNYEEEDVIYEWTVDPGVPPVFVAGATSTVNLGCVPNLGQLPAIDVGQFPANSLCDVTITHVMDTTAAPTQSGCAMTFNRIYKAVDECGNEAEHTQTLVYTIDILPPVIQSLPLGTNYGCVASYPLPVPQTNLVVATDDSRVVSVEMVDEKDTVTGCDHMVIRTWEVTDCCGRKTLDTVMFMYTLMDAPPTVTVNPEVLALGCLPSAGLVPSPNTGALTANSGCSIANQTWVSDTPVLTGPCDYSLERIYQVTDNCDQVGTVTQLITWSVDVEIPKVTATQSGGYLGCNPAGIPPVDLTLVTATDNCGVASIVWHCDITNVVDCLTTITRIYRVTDNCGNQVDSEVIFSYSTDDTRPVLTPAANYQSTIDFGCNPLIVPNANPASFTATDNCGGIIQPQWLGDDVMTTGCAGKIARTYGASDSCGNTTTITQMILFVIDGVAPTPVIAPDNIDLGCASASDVPGPDFTVDSVLDMCTTNVTLTNHISDVYTNFGCLVEITRTYEFTDACGNTGRASQKIRYRDDATAPTIVCPPALELGCNPVVPTPNVGILQATDDCGIQSALHISDTVTTVGCVVTIARLYEVVDYCDNLSSCTRMITYTADTEAPALALPADATVECGDATDSSATGVATAPDGCGGSTTITEWDNNVLGSCGNLETIYRLWTATDACGNAISATQVITVVDTTAPVITDCPAGGTVPCGQVPPADIADVSATDGCGLVFIELIANETLGDICNGDKVVRYVYQAVDECGNRSIPCTQEWAEVDTISPLFTTVAPNTTVQCDADVVLPVTGDFVGTDECDPAPVISILSATNNGGAGCVSDPRVYTTVLQITDCSGNATVHTQTVTVVDDTAPVITSCPADMTLSCSADIPAPNASGVVATDNCQLETPALVSATTNGTGCAGSPMVIVYTYEVLDACGNAAQCAQTLTIMDDAAPSISSCPADIMVSCLAEVPGPMTAQVTGSDNCTAQPAVNLVSATTNLGNGCITAPSIITYTYELVDACGNAAQCVQVITVMDVEAPTLVPCPDPNQEAAVLLSDSQCRFSVPNIMPVNSVQSDNCSDITIRQEPAVGTVLTAPMNTTIELIITDACGNETICAVQLIADCPAAIGNYVWEDLNADGVQDPNEPPLEGVLVTLFDVAGNEVASALTDANGNYLFDGLMPGDYYIQFATPATFMPSPQDMGGDDTNDSDYDPATMTTSVTTLDSGEADPSFDAGFFRLREIEGTVWIDLNNDGIPDNENLTALGLTGVDVTLFSIEGGVTTEVATVTTGPDGYYNFGDLMPGDYEIGIDYGDLPAGIMANPPNQFVTLGDFGTTTVPQADFPVTLNPTSIDGVEIQAVVTEAGVQITWSASVETDVLGYQVKRNGIAVGGLTLANGGTYTVEDAGAIGGSYVLEVVNNDLSSTTEAEVLPTLDATPEGEPTATVLAEDGVAEFTTEAGILSYLVFEFEQAPVITDLTNQRILTGHAVENEGKFGVYFSAEPGMNIRVK